MSDAAGRFTGLNPTDNRRVEYANKLYSEVVAMCQDWHAVDETKARQIIECAQDALKAFGDTNPEKRAKLKKILVEAESCIPPDSIVDFKKRSERLVLKLLHLRNMKHRNAFMITFGVLGLLVVLGVPTLFQYLRTYTGSSATITNNTSQPPLRQEPLAANSPSNQGNSNTASQQDASYDDEAKVIADQATVSLDLTSSWVELDRNQRENERTSRGILRGVFSGVRKISKNATFTHRVGTTSNFKPEWKNISPHNVTDQDETERKCNPKVKYAYMLYFDISKERVNVPFDLKYEIDFWNAHNGETGDWQSFFVSRPTKKLIIRVSFPKNKPATKLHFKHSYGINCQSADFKDFPNPIYKETFDKETGAKVVTWEIDSPQTLWIYMIGWDW